MKLVVQIEVDVDVDVLGVDPAADDAYERAVFALEQALADLTPFSGAQVLD